MKAIRFILVGVGVAAIGYGVFGALTGPRTKPLGHLAFLAGVVVGHELILMPLAIGAGALVVRFVPQRVRGIVQGALLISAAVTLMALPMALGLGGDPTNPSALPLNYGRDRRARAHGSSNGTGKPSKADGHGQRRSACSAATVARSKSRIRPVFSLNTRNTSSCVTPCSPSTPASRSVTSAMVA